MNWLGGKGGEGEGRKFQFEIYFLNKIWKLWMWLAGLEFFQMFHVSEVGKPTAALPSKAYILLSSQCPFGCPLCCPFASLVLAGKYLPIDPLSIVVSTSLSI